MKRKKLRYFIVLLIATMILSVTGCANKVQETPKGKYVEKDITLPTESIDGASNAWVMATGENAQGEVEVAVQDETGCIIVYSMTENESWAEKGKINDWQKEDIYQVLRFQIKDDGMCFLCINEQEELFVYEKDFEGKEIRCSLSDEAGSCKINSNSFYTIGKSNSGDYIVQSAWNGPVKSYDGTTGKYKNTFSEGALSFAVDGDYAIVNNGWDDPVVVTYDIETGNEVKNIAYDIQSDINMVCSNTKGIYILNSKGITFNNGAGTTWEQIVEPDGTRLGGARLEIDSVFAMEDGRVIVGFWGQQGIELVKYYFDPEAKNTYENEITIYMSYDLDLIKAAASLYSKEHPEVKVNIQTWNNDMGYGEEIEQLNTELLTGGGPDMIVLDQLPVQTYIDKGVLLDVSDIAQSYIDEKQGYSDIVNTFKQGDKVYAIPLRFRVPMLWGKAEVINNGSSLEDLARYKQKHTDEIVMNKNLLELAIQMNEISEPYLSDEEGKYNREKMTSYLQMLQNISEEKALLNEEYVPERIDFEPDKYQEIMDVAEGKSAVCIIEPRSFHDIARCDAILDANETCIVAPMTKDGKIIYHTLGNMAINANSKNADIIKEIIKIALSDEIQGEGSWMGLSPSEHDIELQKRHIGGYQDEIVDDQGRRLSIDDQIGETYAICKQSWEEASLSANRIGDVPDMGTSIAYRLQNKEKTLDELLDDLEEKIKIRQGQ